MGSGKKFVSFAQFGWYVRNRKRVLWFCRVYKNTRQSLGELKKLCRPSLSARVPTTFLVLPNVPSCFYLTIRLFALDFYLNNRVFLSRNYRLIVAPRKFDVLKTNICPRSEASRANMLVLRTSNFQGATIRPIVPRHKHSIVFIVHH